MHIFRNKKFLNNIVVIIIFLLLSISITKNIVEIYAVSSHSHSICVPVIMYHQVKNTHLGKDVISPSEFESDLKYLSDNNYHTIVMADLINYVYNDIPLPENPIILSFDDGYLSTYKNVFPLLKKYNMKIVLSIVGKSTDDFSRVHDDNIGYAHMTWDQVKEMSSSGLAEIQNHSYNMHKISNGRYGSGQKWNETLDNYKEALLSDVTKFKTQAEQNANVTPTTFTYPYGKYNDNSEQILKELGYKATLSCRFGVNLINKNPEKLYGLKRICRAHNHGIGKLIKDGMETLRFIKE